MTFLDLFVICLFSFSLVYTLGTKNIDSVFADSFLLHITAKPSSENQQEAEAA